MSEAGKKEARFEKLKNKTKQKTRVRSWCVPRTKEDRDVGKLE